MGAKAQLLIIDDAVDDWKIPPHWYVSKEDQLLALMGFNPIGEWRYPRLKSIPEGAVKKIWVEHPECESQLDQSLVDRTKSPAAEHSVGTAHHSESWWVFPLRKGPHGQK